MKKLSAPIFLLSLLCCSLAVHAEWRTETFSLSPGWNAIYPGVDGTYTTLDQLLAPYPAIVEVWRWQPERVDSRMPGGITAPPVGVEWDTWRKGIPAETSFNGLVANYGYLVHLSETSNPLTISITGRAVLPEVRWRGDGLHLVGFPVVTTGSPPLFTNYLEPTGIGLSTAQILRYNGGAIASGLNPAVTVPTVSHITRGQAYWVQVNKYSRFYGPISVALTGGQKIDFATASSVQSMVLTNLTNSPVSYTLDTVSSSPAPTGQTPVAGAVPVQIEVDADPAYATPTTGRTLTLAAGAVSRVKVMINRAQISPTQGTHYASMLHLVTTAGVAGEEVFVPMTADSGNMAGLWIGEAQIDHVGSVLIRYARDASGKTQYDSSGNPLVLEDLTTPGSGGTLPAVSNPYTLRVLLHVNSSGRTTLLSQILQGTLRSAAPGDPAGLTLQESLLDPASLSTAVRLSVAHLPLDTALTLTGSFAPGGGLTGAPLVTPYDSAVNPFVHTYHPDHDNLDARFQNKLPAGKESFDIRRTFTIAFDAAAPATAGPDWGATNLTGSYGELMEGPYKSPIRVQGTLSLFKVSDVPFITGF